jgi:hypothetical protein
VKTDNGLHQQIPDAATPPAAGCAFVAYRMFFLGGDKGGPPSAGLDWPPAAVVPDGAAPVAMPGHVSQNCS